nr:hypothetical protein [Tanacetum cinerariifolium]
MDCGEELKNYDIVDVEEGECVVQNRGEMMNEQEDDVIMDLRINDRKDNSEDVVDCESKKESAHNEEHKMLPWLRDDEDGMINKEKEMHDEDSDVYEECEGLASMIAQNEMNYSYAAVLNGSVDRGKGDTN